MTVANAGCAEHADNLFDLSGLCGHCVDCLWSHT
jgi:hypothetical protein